MIRHFRISNTGIS